MKTTEKLRRWRLLAIKRADLIQEAQRDAAKAEKNAAAWSAANHRQIGVIQRYRAALKECQRRATSKQPGDGHFGIAGVVRAALKRDS